MATNVSQLFCEFPLANYEWYTDHIFKKTNFWADENCVFLSLLLEQTKYVKMPYKEIPSLDCNVFYFICMSL